MEMQDSPVSKRGSRSSTFHLVLIGLGVAALIIIIAITSITLNRLPAPSQAPKPTLRQRFPGYFRTEAEQRVFQEEMKKTRPATGLVRINVTNVCDTSNCSLGLPNRHNYIPVRPAEEVRYNACCVSVTLYKYPSYMVDVTGVNRTISTFDGNRQYFFTETCEHVEGCDFCQCSTTNYLVTAVYDDGPDNYNIGWFSLPGCCKCYN